MATTEFVIKLKLYTPAATLLLGEIAATLARIEHSNILLPAADVVRSKALAETIHYSNMIEGNELSQTEAMRATKGLLDKTTKMKVELVNYVEALQLIDERLDSGSLELTPEFVMQLHGAATKDLGREDESFKPRHEGKWRDGMAVVHNPISGEIIHEGAKPDEVQGRMAGMLERINAKLNDPDWNVFVVAGVLHHAIVNIHPFADGNGRIARLMQIALLLKENAIPGKFIAFDRYYAEDRSAYYAALASADGPARPMNRWIEYFLKGIDVEAKRALATIEEIDRTFSGDREAKPQLSDSQVKTILDLSDQREFTRADYQSVSGLSRNKAVADLKALAEAKIVFQIGSGPSVRYARSKPAERRGSRKQWTEERIAQELRSFVGSRKAWPTFAEFAAADKEFLYQAMSRSGGIKRWRSLVGL